LAFAWTFLCKIAIAKRIRSDMLSREKRREFCANGHGGTYTVAAPQLTIKIGIRARFMNPMQSGVAATSPTDIFLKT
jgi:hypothetical protein